MEAVRFPVAALGEPAGRQYDGGRPGVDAESLGTETRAPLYGTGWGEEAKQCDLEFLSD